MRRSHARWVAVLAFALALTSGIAAAARPHHAAARRGSAHTFFGGVIRDVRTGTRVRAPRPRTAHAANLPYGGGPVLHWNRTHVVFWQPTGSGLSFDAGYQTTIATFLGDVAADSRKPTNVYSLSGQYHDDTGPAAYSSSFAGAVVASDPLPPNHCAEPLGPPAGSGPGWLPCLDDGQLQSELESVIRAQNLPATGNDVYFIVLPDGLGTCEFSGPENCALGGETAGSFCGYHSSMSTGVPYAVIPYNAVPGHCQSGNPRPNASTADPTISTISHEHNEIATDPLGDGWIDTATSSEDGDLCITTFGPPLGGVGAAAYNEIVGGHHYYLQEEWSNDDASCQARDEADRISFTIDAPARARRPVTFTAHASDPDGSIAYNNWYFGDRGSGRSRRVSHTFKRAGSYRVVLRTTDSAGNWAFDAVTIHVGRGSSRDRVGRRPHKK